MADTGDAFIVIHSGWVLCDILTKRLGWKEVSRAHKAMHSWQGGSSQKALLGLGVLTVCAALLLFGIFIHDLQESITLALITFAAGTKTGGMAQREKERASVWSAPY